MQVGDHIKVVRWPAPYAHHGIYVGEGQVIHFNGTSDGKSSATIRLDSLETFCGRHIPEVVTYAKCLAPEFVADRARGRLGWSGYDLFANNCEHFARWCKTDEHKSEQCADAGAIVGGSAATAASIALLMDGVVSAGAASGAAGLMSGLAKPGGLLGGGVTSGIVAASVVPTICTHVAIAHLLADDDALPVAERDARQAARSAAVVGSVAGTVGTIGIIAAAGAPGLSAAGITSGLAALGKLFRGGMGRGAAAALALPAVVGITAGIGVYLYRKQQASRQE